MWYFICDIKNVTLIPLRQLHNTEIYTSGAGRRPSAIQNDYEVRGCESDRAIESICHVGLVISKHHHEMANVQRLEISSDGHLCCPYNMKGNTYN